MSFICHQCVTWGPGEFQIFKVQLFWNQISLDIFLYQVYFLMRPIEYSLCLPRQIKYLHVELFQFYRKTIKEYTSIAFCFFFFLSLLFLHLLLIGSCQAVEHGK